MTSGPFTYQQALARGITRAQLTSAAYRRLLRGIYVPSTTRVDAYVEGQAALLAGPPGAFLSHHTAARLWGGVVPHSDRFHVSVPPGRARPTRKGLLVHRSRRAPVRYRRLPVTAPLDTFLDSASVLDLVSLVVLGDGLIRARRCSVDQLVDASAAATGRGTSIARRAARLVRAGVDSPMETRARMLRVLAGLPELETDVRFFDAWGNLTRRLDAADRHTRTAVEYDGRHHMARQEQWEADLGRREEFEDQDWRIVTLTSRDLYRTPGRTVDRLHRIFRARGLVVGPRRDEWRRFFPDQG